MREVPQAQTKKTEPEVVERGPSRSLLTDLYETEEFKTAWDAREVEEDR